MNEIIAALRAACTDKGVVFKVGWLKQYTEYRASDSKFPLLWILPIDFTPERVDDNPSMYVTYQINGFYVNNVDREATDDDSYTSVETSFLEVIKYLDWNYEKFIIENIEAQAMPENFTDRAYGYRISMDISKHIDISC